MGPPGPPSGPARKSPPEVQRCVRSIAFFNGAREIKDSREREIKDSREREIKDSREWEIKDSQEREIKDSRERESRTARNRKSRTAGNGKMAPTAYFDAIFCPRRRPRKPFYAPGEPHRTKMAKRVFGSANQDPQNEHILTHFPTHFSTLFRERSWSDLGTSSTRFGSHFASILAPFWESSGDPFEK